MLKKKCMLEEDKICDNCLECDSCDLDPKKNCDNCAKCVDSVGPYRSLEIRDIVYVGGLKKSFRLIDNKKASL